MLINDSVIHSSSTRKQLTGLILKRGEWLAWKAGEVDVKKTQNGERHCWKLQINERIKHQWSISPKYKVNWWMQQTSNLERWV